MVETVIRIVIFVVLASFAVWYCNDWFKKKQKLTVSRTRKKWKRLCKDESFDGRSIASQRLDSRRLLKFGRIISFPIVVLLAAYISNFAFKLPSSEPEQWGQMGDFFGGMLNPILAFASFIALLYTIRIQSKEMEDTRIELKESRIAQQKSAINAEKQLKAQLLLVEYEALKELLVVEINSLSAYYNRGFDGRAVSELVDYALTRNDVNEKTSFSELSAKVASAISPSGKFASLANGPALNFVISVHNATGVFTSFNNVCTELMSEVPSRALLAYADRLGAYFTASLLIEGDLLSLEACENNILRNATKNNFDFYKIDITPP